MGLASAPRIPEHLLGCEIMRPCQWPGSRYERAVGPRALLLRLLADALHQADLGPLVRRQGPMPRNGSSPGRKRTSPAQVIAARRWLAGELDGQVALPVTFVCDALGLDAGVLAAAVRARTTP
jgi:hypothetical protein